MFLITTVLIYSIAYSNQIDKKDIEIGGLLGLSFDKIYTSYDKQLLNEYTIQIEPKLSYYVLEKLYIGPNISLLYQYTDFEKYNVSSIDYVLSLGFHIGMNIWKFKNIYPFIQSGIDYSLIRTIDDPFDYYNHAINVNVACGLKLLIGTNLLIYTQFDYSHWVKYWNDSDFKNFNEKLKLKLGVGGLINRSK